MKRQFPAARALVCALATGALTACSFNTWEPHMGSSQSSAHASAAADHACRQQTDQRFISQNRAILYRDDQVGLPFSAGGVSGINPQRLSEDYAYENAYDDCISGIQDPRGAPSGTLPKPPPATAP